MHPDLEFFLESAFDSIQPISPHIGRVVVEPDYEIEPHEQDASQLRNELTQCLSSAKPKSEEMASHDGYEAKIGSRFPLLAKYIRRVTLHANRLEGPWIEVAPPGNWI